MRIDFEWWSDGSWKPCGRRGRRMGRAVVATVTAKPAIRPDTRRLSPSTPKSSCSNTAPSNPKSKKSLSNIHGNGDGMVQDRQGGIAGDGRTEATTAETPVRRRRRQRSDRGRGPVIEAITTRIHHLRATSSELGRIGQMDSEWRFVGMVWRRSHDFVRRGNEIGTGAGVGVSAWGGPRGGGKSRGCCGQRGRFRGGVGRGKRNSNGRAA
mmetsp:Transcript_32995/g.67430  ORF Transcript_32995/g.67430 Transcript_32995/m.67430 type:complete len:210 (+) Transcript_32995:906-1535(+)